MMSRYPLKEPSHRKRTTGEATESYAYDLCWYGRYPERMYRWINQVLQVIEAVFPQTENELCVPSIKSEIQLNLFLAKGVNL